MSPRERRALWIAVAIALVVASWGVLDVLEGASDAVVVVMEVVLPLVVAVLGTYAALRDRRRRKPPPAAP